MSAYHLSGGDPIYLEKAKELGDRILPTFDTPSGLPLSQVNLGLRKGIYDPDYPGLVSTAEVSTLQLEFRYLAYLTDEEIYWEKAEHVRISLLLPLLFTKYDISQVMAVIKAARMSHGLASIFMKSVSFHAACCHLTGV